MGNEATAQATGSFEQQSYQCYLLENHDRGVDRHCSLQPSGAASGERFTDYRIVENVSTREGTSGFYLEPTSNGYGVKLQYKAGTVPRYSITVNQVAWTGQGGGGSCDAYPCEHLGEDYESFENPAKPYKLNVEARDRNNNRLVVPVTISVDDEAAEKPWPPVITDLTALSDTSVRVTWAKAVNYGHPSITGYRLKYGRTSTKIITDGSATESTITGLEPDTEYRIQVSARNAHGWSEPSHLNKQSDGSSPKIRTLLYEPEFSKESYGFELMENVAAGTVGAVSATHQGGQDVTYSITAGDTSLFSIDASDGVISYTGSGENYESFADAASAYIITVMATDDANHTDTAQVTIAVTNAPEPPARMAAPTLTAGWDGSLRVSWTAPDNDGLPAITGYRLRYRASHAGDDKAANQFRRIDDPEATEAVITGLTPWTEYRLQVRAENGDGKPRWSPERFVGIFGFDVASYDFEIAENVDGTVEPADLNDDTVVGGLVDGLAYAITAGDTDRFAIDRNSGEMGYTGSGEDYETGSGSYALTVTAQSKDGHSASVPVTVTVANVEEPPKRMANPAVTALPDGSLRVSWRAPDNDGLPAITGYRLRYRPDDADKGAVRVQRVADATATEATISKSDLLPGKKYWVRVRAENYEARGQWSPRTQATTLDPGSGESEPGGDPSKDGTPQPTR